MVGGYCRLGAEGWRIARIVYWVASPQELRWKTESASRSLARGRIYVRDCGSASLGEECGPEGLKEPLDWMDRMDMRVDFDTCVSVLRYCSNTKSLCDGKRAHAQIISIGYDGDRFLSNLLVQMYGSCGCPEDARGVFDRMRRRNVFSWNIMIQAYADNGRVEDARTVFDKMPERDIVSWTAVMNMYGKCGRVDDARNAFNNMPQRDIISWNTMIAA
eukprot:c21044_g1_i1 orf=66-716(+)